MKKIKKFNICLLFFVFIFSLYMSVSFSKEIKKLADSCTDCSYRSVITLSIDQVTELALQNSLDIQIAKLDAYISRTSLKKEESIFDTFLTAQASYNHDKKKQASTLLANEKKDSEFSLGLEKKLPTGTTLYFDAYTLEEKTDSTLSALNPYHEVKLGVSLTQELGRNFFGLADRANIKITKLDIENSEFTSLDNIENFLYLAQEAYWNLTLKVEELSIKEDMLNKARGLYLLYQNKKELGLIEESDILAIEALVYERQSDVEIARLNRETAKNNLLFLLNKGEFNKEIIPQDGLECDIAKVNLFYALKEAIENRRDYKKLGNEAKRNTIDIVIKKNSLWPEIDLDASFFRNNLDSNRETAWEGLGHKSNDEILFTLTFKMPLENRAAKADLEKVNYQKEQILLKLKRIERLILQELNNQVNEVNTVSNQVKLFKSTVKIHKKKLDAEIRRLNFGRSNADTIIRYEEDVLNSRLSLVSYLFKYRKSLIKLELIKNTLLDKYWKEPL